MKRILLILGSVLTFSLLCWAIRITVTGSWTENIDSSDLQGAPGTDLRSTYQSASNQVDIDITSVEGRWDVYIRKVDSTWHAGFALFARRTSSGSGGGTHGGTTYQELTATNTRFFWSTSSTNRRNVYIQYQLTGVSIQIPPGTYRTTIYYYVYENE